MVKRSACSTVVQICQPCKSVIVQLTQPNLWEERQVERISCEHRQAIHSLCISDLFEMAVTIGKKKRDYKRRLSLPPPASSCVKPIDLPNGRFACLFCDRIYSTRAACSSHLKFHLGLTRCQFCIRSFATKQTLAMHMKTCGAGDEFGHPKSLKVACKICDKKVAFRCLNRHIQLVHKINPDVVKSVDTEPVVVLKRNLSLSALAASVPEKSQNKENLIFEKSGKFFCNKCCKTFSDKATCETHTALHYSVNEPSA